MPFQFHAMELKLLTSVGISNLPVAEKCRILGTPNKTTHMVKPELNKKLIAYSLFANASLIAGNVANGQVVYVDINPDVVLDVAGEEYLLDIDADGEADFRFVNTSFLIPSAPTFTYTSNISFMRQDLAAGPEISQNAIAGLSDYIEAASGGFTRYYPYRMNKNNIIDSSLSWQNPESQVLVVKEVINSNEQPVNSGGYWIGDAIDKYLGIRFKDEDNEKHYGWVRCDVLNDGRTLIIKDYAIELEANQAIRAGSQLAINDNVMEANVFFDQNMIHVIFTARPEEYVQFRLFDLSGKQLFQTQIIDQDIKLEVDLMPGIYAVKMTSSTVDHGSTLFIK